MDNWNRRLLFFCSQKHEYTQGCITNETAILEEDLDESCFKITRFWGPATAYITRFGSIDKALDWITDHLDDYRTQERKLLC